VAEIKTKICPYCAQPIPEDATECSHCNSIVGQKRHYKWYFKTSVLVTAFLCAGPFALPLLWLNPHLNYRNKILISILVVVFSWYVWVVFVNSAKLMVTYYQELFHPSF